MLEVLKGAAFGLEHLERVEHLEHLKSNHTPPESQRVPVIRSHAMMTGAAD